MDEQQNTQSDDQIIESNPNEHGGSVEETNDQKAQEYLLGWQRAKADFANYKKEEAMRMQEFAQYAAVDIIRDIITVLDSFHLAIMTAEKNGEVEKGIYLIKGQLEDVLRKRGVEMIPIRAGDGYDPAVAETIGEVEADGITSGCVVDVIENGYRLHGKVIRPARVRIAK